MITKVNDVFVTSTGLFSGADLDDLDDAAVGDVVIKGTKNDGSIVIVDAAADVTAAITTLQMGLVQSIDSITLADGTASTVANIQWAAPVQKGGIVSCTTNEFEAATEDAIVIAFGTFTPEVGYRYVLRIQRKDIHEHPGTMTYSYEYTAKTATLADLIAAFVKQINKDSRPGVIATTANDTLTLTAQAKPYHVEDGYSQVSIEAFMHQTIPSGLLSTAIYAIPGVTITKTPGTAGKGNPYIVNDREWKALGYRGVWYRDSYYHSQSEPKLNTVFSAEYDELVVEFESAYRSPDNQYLKTTPHAVEVYGVTDIDTIAAIFNKFAGLA